MTSPVPGGIGTPYGVPGSWAAGVHTGEDYPCPSGTPVLAAAGGTVMKAGDQGDYGLRVDVRCSADGCEHSYSHLSRIDVHAGQAVSAGQQVGLSGNTGRSSGPHLHYEERDNPYGYHNHRAPVHTGSAPSDGDDDMTPQQAATLDQIAWMAGQIKAQTDQINPRLMTPVDQSAWGINDSDHGVRAMVADLAATVADLTAAVARIEETLGDS